MTVGNAEGRGNNGNNDEAMVNNVRLVRMRHVKVWFGGSIKASVNNCKCMI